MSRLIYRKNSSDHFVAEVVLNVSNLVKFLSWFVSRALSNPPKSALDHAPFFFSSLPPLTLQLIHSREANRLQQLVIRLGYSTDRDWGWSHYAEETCGTHRDAVGVEVDGSIRLLPWAMSAKDHLHFQFLFVGIIALYFFFQNSTSRDQKGLWKGLHLAFCSRIWKLTLSG